MSDFGAIYELLAMQAEDEADLADARERLAEVAAGGEVETWYPAEYDAHSTAWMKATVEAWVASLGCAPVAAKTETEVEAWARRSVEKAQAAVLVGGLGNVAAPAPAETDTDRTLSDDAGRNVDRAFGR